MINRSDVLKYKRNFLSNVIVQINFSPIKRFFENVPHDIIEGLKRDYDFQQGQPFSEVQVNISTGARIETAIPVWEFKSKDNTLLIQLTQNLLRFNFTKYINFDNLMIHIRRVASLLENDLTTISRLSLRYINQIDLEETQPTNWTEYIDDSLICQINKWCDASKNNLARAMNQIVLNEDDYTMNFNYGIYNPIFPNTVIQKQYILDYDCYGKNIDFQNLDKLLHLYNLAITKAFEASIKDGLRKKMEVIDE